MQSEQDSHKLNGIDIIAKGGSTVKPKATKIPTPARHFGIEVKYIADIIHDKIEPIPNVMDSML